jgi:hypothetical protein
VHVGIPNVTNTYSENVLLIDFSTATIAARTRLNVTLCTPHDKLSCPPTINNVCHLVSPAIEKPDFNKKSKRKRKCNGSAQTYFPMLTTLMTSKERDKNERVLDWKNVFAPLSYSEVKIILKV